ncbi:hypothetical protein FQZ97_1065980 [compost metagenome]
MQLFGWRQGLVEGGKEAVEFVGRLHGVNGLVELGQDAVAQALDQPAAPLRQHLRSCMAEKAVPVVHHRRLVGRHQSHRFHQVHHKDHPVVLQRQRRSQVLMT